MLDFLAGEEKKCKKRKQISGKKGKKRRETREKPRKEMPKNTLIEVILIYFYT